MTLVGAWAEWLPESAQKFVRQPFTSNVTLEPGNSQASPQDSAVIARKPTHEFPSSRGRVSVREENALGFLRGTAARACCVTTGEEFDLRRLRVGAEAGGHVTLAALEAVGREVELMTEVALTPHLHVVGCHASLIENTGGTHARLLLCDPCVGDLVSHVLATASADGVARLQTEEATEIGQQVAFGVAHLHSLDLLCGSALNSRSVLRGRDGCWKVADFSCCRRLPIWSSEWSTPAGQASPPEVNSSCADVELTTAADIWMLGRLLAEVGIEGCSRSSSTSGESLEGCVRGDEAPLVPPQELLQPLVARVWLLLHWLLIAEPSQRPNAGEVAALLGKTLCYMTPTELLDDMPVAASERVLATAVAAARQMALEAVATRTAGGAARGALIDRLAGAPLPIVREALANTAAADELEQLCSNCGIEGRRADGLIVDAPAVESTVASGSKAIAHRVEDASSTDAGSSQGDLLSFEGDPSSSGFVVPTKVESNLPDLIEFTGNPFGDSSPF